MKIECERCKGSGTLGFRGSREIPGPVPEDARGWAEIDCPDCRGTGEIEVDDPEEEEDEE